MAFTYHDDDKEDYFGLFLCSPAAIELSLRFDTFEDSWQKLENSIFEPRFSSLKINFLTGVLMSQFAA